MRQSTTVSSFVARLTAAICLCVCSSRTTVVQATPAVAAKDAVGQDAIVVDRNDDRYHCTDPAFYVNTAITCNATTSKWNLDDLDPQAPPVQLCGPAETLHYTPEQIAVLPDAMEPCLLWLELYGNRTLGVIDGSPTPADDASNALDVPGSGETSSPTIAPNSFLPEPIELRIQEFTPFTLIFQFQSSSSDLSNTISSSSSSMGSPTGNNGGRNLDSVDDTDGNPIHDDSLVLNRAELFKLTYRHILETLQAKIFFHDTDSTDDSGPSDSESAGTDSDSIQINAGAPASTAVQELELVLTTTRLALSPRPTLYETVSGFAIFLTAPLVIEQQRLDRIVQEAFAGNALDLYLLRLRLSKDPGLQQVATVLWISATDSNELPSPSQVEQLSGGSNGDDGGGDGRIDGPNNDSSDNTVNSSQSSNGLFQDVDWSSTPMIVIIVSVVTATFAICLTAFCLLCPCQSQRATRRGNTERSLAISRSASSSPTGSSIKLRSTFSGSMTSTSRQTRRAHADNRNSKNAGTGGRKRPKPVNTFVHTADSFNASTFDDVEDGHGHIDDDNLESPGYEGEEFVDSDDMDSQSLANRSLYSYSMIGAGGGGGGSGAISAIVLEDDASLSIAPSILNSIDEQDKHNRRVEASHEFRDSRDDDDDDDDNEGLVDGAVRGSGGTTPKISPVWSIMSQLQQHFGGDDSDDSDSPKVSESISADIEAQRQHQHQIEISEPAHVNRHNSLKLQEILSGNRNSSINSSRTSSGILFHDNDDSQSLISDTGVGRVLKLDATTNALVTPTTRQNFHELWNEDETDTAIRRDQDQSGGTSVQIAAVADRHHAEHAKTVRKSNRQCRETTNGPFTMHHSNHNNSQHVGIETNEDSYAVTPDKARVGSKAETAKRSGTMAVGRDAYHADMIRKDADVRKPVTTSDHVMSARAATDKDVIAPLYPGTDTRLTVSTAVKTNGKSLWPSTAVDLDEVSSTASSLISALPSPVTDSDTADVAVATADDDSDDDGNKAPMGDAKQTTPGVFGMNPSASSDSSDSRTLDTVPGSDGDSSGQENTSPQHSSSPNTGHGDGVAVDNLPRSVRKNRKSKDSWVSPMSRKAESLSVSQSAMDATAQKGMATSTKLSGPVVISNRSYREALSEQLNVASGNTDNTMAGAEQMDTNKLGQSVLVQKDGKQGGEIGRPVSPKPKDLTTAETASLSVSASYPPRSTAPNNHRAVFPRTAVGMASKQGSVPGDSSDDDCYVEDSDKRETSPVMIRDGASILAASLQRSAIPPRHTSSLKSGLKPWHRPVQRSASTSSRRSARTRSTALSTSGEQPHYVTESFSGILDSPTNRDELSVRSDGTGTVDGSVLTHDPNWNYRWESSTMASF